MQRFESMMLTRTIIISTGKETSPTQASEYKINGQK
jgi:hypothetical protein